MIQLLRRALHIDVCGLHIRIQRNRTVSSAGQRPELFGDWSGQRVAEMRGALRFDLLDLDQEAPGGMLSQFPFEQLRAREFQA